MPQEARKTGGVQVPACARDREREPGTGERPERVAGEVGEARDAPRLEELRGLDREGERGGDQRRREHRDRAVEARGEEPREAGAEREVQQHVRGDVAARRAGRRQRAEPRERLRLPDRKAERIEQAEDDQEHDHREEGEGGDAAVVRDHALTRAARSGETRGPRRPRARECRATGRRGAAARAHALEAANLDADAREQAPDFRFCPSASVTDTNERSPWRRSFIRFSTRRPACARALGAALRRGHVRETSPLEAARACRPTARPGRRRRYSFGMRGGSVSAMRWASSPSLVRSAIPSSPRRPPNGINAVAGGPRRGRARRRCATARVARGRRSRLCAC